MSALGSLTHGGSDLEGLSLAPATRLSYSNALRKFLSFASTSLDKLESRRSRSVDRLLTDFLNHLHRSGGSFTDGSHAVHGLIAALPHLQYKLPRSRRSLKGWDRHREHKSHPPLTWELTVTIALAMAAAGRDGHALCTLLAFDGYMRISEYTVHAKRGRALRRRDIASAGDVRLGPLSSAMAVALRDTKTGPNRSFSVNSPAVAASLQDYLDAHRFSPDDIVFPFTHDQYRRSFHETTQRLGLASLGLVPHSLRHGGATRDFMLGRSIEQIAHRGRWASVKSAGRYVQQGPALLLYNSVPAALVQAGRTLEPHLVACLRHLRSTVPAAAPHQLKRVRFGTDTPGRC